MATLIPTIKWSQNDEYIIINLEISKVKNDVYEINNNNNKSLYFIIYYNLYII